MAAIKNLEVEDKNSRVQCSHEESEIVSFAGTQVELYTIVLSNISQTQVKLTFSFPYGI